MVWGGSLQAVVGGVTSALVPSLAALLPLAKDPELFVRIPAAIVILIKEMPTSGSLMLLAPGEP